MLPARAALQVNRVYHSDALTLLQGLEDASIDLICTDPPYNIDKVREWDKWPTDAAYIEWLHTILAQFKRVLKPNGSLYLFAAPRLAARVEVAVGEHFYVLNRITWNKPKFSTKAEMFDKETMRGYFPASEAIIFAEQYGSDEHASGEAGYEAQCQAACRQVFQIGELCTRCNISRADIGRLIVSDYKNMESAQAQASNWILGKNIPNPSDFEKLKTILPIKGEYSELRREYEELRREYEELRRPFNVTPFDPYTDVWTFATVGHYDGKHLCEKPLTMMEHIIKASSKPNAVVLDCFCGSGSTLDAASRLGRKYIGGDFDAHWVAYSRKRVSLPFTPLMFAA